MDRMGTAHSIMSIIHLIKGKVKKTFEKSKVI